MAPIKFEERLKDKLEKRRVMPSANSWSKLNERLDSDEKKSKKPFFWWLSIAACLFVMIAITVQFSSIDEADNTKPKMVEKKILEEQFEDENKKSNTNNSIELAIEIDNELETKQKSSLPKNASEIENYRKTMERKADISPQLASQNNSVIKDKTLNNKKELQEQLVLIDSASVKEALADASQDINSDKLDGSDREIDSLLKIANKELFQEKRNIEILETVDADALLESVEDDMGEAYRGKVFRALKESYKTIKTAVVNRNN